MRWTVQMSQKYILPHLPKATSLGDKHALHKDNLATRNGELSKVIANIKTATSPGGGGTPIWSGGDACRKF